MQVVLCFTLGHLFKDIEDGQILKLQFQPSVASQILVGSWLQEGRLWFREGNEINDRNDYLIAWRVLKALPGEVGWVGSGNLKLTWVPSASLQTSSSWAPCNIQ